MNGRALLISAARRFWPAVGIACLVLLLVAVRASRTTDHTVRASFDAAVGLRSGMDVQLDGLDVGKVRDVSYDHGRADVVLGINSGPAWPLPQGTRAVLRHGTTIGSATRRVDLVLGEGSARPIPDGGILPASSTQSPVEWDEALGTFDRRTRASVRKATSRGAAVLDGRSNALSAGMRRLPAGGDALADVLEDFDANRAALAQLFPLTDRVTATLARRHDKVSAVVLVAQRTLQVFADRSREVRASLGALPPTLAQLTTSLGRLDRTSSRLRPVLASLAPGARELRDLDRTLAPAVHALRGLTSPGLGLVAEVDRTAPLRRLLGDLGPLLRDDALPALREAAPMLACISPYAPEIGGMLSNWTSWQGNDDGRGKYGRYHIMGGPLTVAQLGSAGTLAAAARMPGVRYARALRPGELAGEPRNIPACGYTAALHDVDKDPEAGR